MDFAYDKPPTSLPLRQGEILQDIIELIPETPNAEILASEPTTQVEAVRTHYPYAIVVTQDCDLNGDWEARQEEPQSEGGLLTHVSLCELFEENDIKQPRELTGKLWGFVKSNQHERYHHLVEANVGEDTEDGLPDLYADFKRIFSLPRDYMYDLVTVSISTRVALLPYPHMRDFSHRLHSFLSRIPIP